MLRNADRIAPGPDGAMWFTQEGFQFETNALGRITTAGAVKPVAIPSGSTALALTAGPDGALWYAGFGSGPDGLGTGGGRLGRVTATASTEIALPGSPFSASAIVIGPDHALWFTADDRIGRRAPDGTLTFLRIPGADLKRLVAAPDALWFTGYSKRLLIGRITTSGVMRLFRFSPTAFSTRDIAVGADGALWFTSRNPDRIRRISTSGRLRTFPLPNQPDSPNAITAGPDGALWFTSLQIGRITPTGEITEIDVPNRHPPLLSFPRGIATGPDGAIWFTQQDTDENVDNGSERGDIGRIDLPRIGKQLLVARLADGRLRGHAKRLLRIGFIASRKASGVLRLRLRGHLALRRRVSAHPGSNSVTVRLPRKAARYELLLNLSLASQTAAVSGHVTVTH
jgi:virginiamycin B lyase